MIVLLILSLVTLGESISVKPIHNGCAAIDCKRNCYGSNAIPTPGDNGFKVMLEDTMDKKYIPNKEYKIEENYIGQLWSMAEVSRLNTSGGEGVEIMKNDFFTIPAMTADITKYLPDYDLTTDSTDSQHASPTKKLHSSKSLGALSKLLKREASCDHQNGNHHDSKTSNGHHGAASSNEHSQQHKLVKQHEQNGATLDSNSDLNMYSSVPSAIGNDDSDILTTKYDKTLINTSEVKTKNGQYTYKIYKIASKFPWFIRRILPRESTILHEKSWNLYPIIKTHIKNEYMKDKFHVYINTITKECVNGVIEENVHNLTAEQLEKREIVIIDITEPVPAEEYVAEEDPTKYQSQKAKRGPLKENWIKTQRPLICCYKLIEMEFIWFPLTTKAESYMANMYKKLFVKFHRQIFCWMDKWYDLSLQDVRKYEIDLQKTLTEKINNGEIAANPFEVSEQ